MDAWILNLHKITNPNWVDFSTPAHPSPFSFPLSLRSSLHLSSGRCCCSVSAPRLMKGHEHLGRHTKEMVLCWRVEAGTGQACGKRNGCIHWVWLVFSVWARKITQSRIHKSWPLQFPSHKWAKTGSMWQVNMWNLREVGYKLHPWGRNCRRHKYTSLGIVGSTILTVCLLYCGSNLPGGDAFHSF